MMPYKDKSRYQSEEWKEYQRNYQRSWHQRHKVARLARIYEKKAATYEYIQSIKKQLCCADCGEQHPAVLQFHHLNAKDKTFNIADAAQNALSVDRINKEIEKCTETLDKIAKVLGVDVRELLESVPDNNERE